MRTPRTDIRYTLQKSKTRRHDMIGIGIAIAVFVVFLLFTGQC